MTQTFDLFYRQLARTTFGLLIAALTCYGITLLCAVLGLANAVASLNGVTLSLACVFVATLAIFLVASVVAAAIRWMERRSQVSGAKAL